MNAPTPAGSFAHAQKAPVTMLLPLGVIAMRDQIRKVFDEAELQELAASLKADGQIQPIVVRKIRGPEASERFELIAGERRCRAAALAGLDAIRAEVHEDLDDTGVHVLQLVENVQRVDLSLPEQCESVAALVKQLEGVDGKTGQQNASEKLGKSLAWVSRRAGLVEAPIEVRRLVKSGRITDVEIASGLAELHQVAQPATFQSTLRQAEEENHYAGPLTRKGIRDTVAAAKELAKHRKAQAEARKKDKGKKPAPNSWQAHQKREQEEKAQRIERWKAVGPLVTKFSDAVAKATGLDIEGPRVDGYTVDAVPTSIEACPFQWTFEGTAASAKQLVSKTGLTLKLECRLPALTPDQALKVEQTLGAKLRWTKEWSRAPLTGKQLATMAAKAGAKVELPQLPKPAPAVTPEAKPAPKAAKKKAR